MKAVIEKKDGVYLIRIYSSDGLCDAYAIEEINLKEGDNLIPFPEDLSALFFQ